MRGNSGLLLIALGILLLYVVLSDKYVCFVEFFSCLTGTDMRTPEGYTQSVAPAAPASPAAPDSYQLPRADPSNPDRPYGPTVGDYLLKWLGVSSLGRPSTPPFAG
jgi:hypothetical protein